MLLTPKILLCTDYLIFFHTFDVPSPAICFVTTFVQSTAGNMEARGL